MTLDATGTFQKLHARLIPQGETIRGVIRATPKGESWRRSQQVNVRVPAPKPTPITYEGIAAEWPTEFARHDSVPDAWSASTDWFFWLVVTEKQLHVFEGRVGEGWKGTFPAGPEAAQFPLEKITEITFDKGAISQLAIYFVDGSVVELEAGMQKFKPFLQALAPFVRADSVRPRSTGWMPPGWGSILGIALLVGGMATSIGGTAEGETPVLIVGILAIVAGTIFLLRAWRASGWKRRRAIGIPLLLLGLFFGAASLDDSCECRGFLYTSIALVVIGLVAQFARIERPEAELR